MAQDHEELMAWIERTGACCPQCGYSLRGLTEPRCPECGALIRFMPPEVAWRRKHNSKVIAGVTLSALASAYLGFGGSTTTIAVLSTCMGLVGFACAIGALLAWNYRPGRLTRGPNLRAILWLAWVPFVVNAPLLAVMATGVFG